MKTNVGYGVVDTGKIDPRMMEEALAKLAEMKSKGALNPELLSVKAKKGTSVLIQAAAKIN